jgi:hypothetical protein
MSGISMIFKIAPPLAFQNAEDGGTMTFVSY